MDKYEKLVFQPVEPEDEFVFQCVCCGVCCRNVPKSVLIESLDLFRIAKHLGKEPSEIMNDYTVPVFLARNFPVLMMKTTDPEDTCVFLKDG